MCEWFGMSVTVKKKWSGGVVEVWCSEMVWTSDKNGKVGGIY